jgi:hypothetical protein
MRMLSSNAGAELQLELVQETSEQVTFQRGKLSQSETIVRGWHNAMPGILGLGTFCLLILTSMWQAGVFKSIPSNPIGINLFLLLWSMLMFGVPLGVAAYSLLRACFVTWTFNRIDRTIRSEGVNLFGQKKVKFYQFDEIEKIVVELVEDMDSSYLKCCELYFQLRSGQEFTVSQGYYTRDRREQAIALHSHRKLAELMRDCLGQVTPAADKAERVYIPNQREIAAERSNDWEMIKSASGALFSSKEKRQTDIENIQEKLITDREDAQLWETLSFHLAMSRDSYRASIEALSQAEAIYRDRGDIIKADELAKKISLFEAKI